MKGTIFVILLFLVVGLGLTGKGLAVEKIRYGTAIKQAPAYYLPILAAEEKGFWKEQWLAVEWLPVGTTKAMHAAIAAGSLNLGLDTAVSMIHVIGRGVPATIVADHQFVVVTGLWVRADSPAKQPKDLEKGAKIGVMSLGGTDHAYGRMLLSALGMEQNVRFVATGGVRQGMAAVKTGAVDAVTMTRNLMIPLLAKGEVRLLAKQEDYVKASIMGNIQWARSSFLNENPGIIAKGVKAILRANAFVTNNRDWSLEKMKENQGISGTAGELLYEYHRFSTDGKISRQAIENTINFVVEYGLLPKDKAPQPEKVYTTQFTS